MSSIQHPEITLKNLAELLERGFKLREDKQYDEAYQIAKACFEKFPQQGDVQCLMGCCLADQKKTNEAIKHLNIAIAINPEKCDYYIVLGHLLVEIKLFQEAENTFLQCLKINKDHLLATFNLGVVYHNQIKYLEAEKLFVRATSIKPDFYEAYYHLGICYQMENKIPEAIIAYEKALIGLPHHPGLIGNMGSIYFKDIQFKKALRFFKQALTIDPENVPAISNIGGLYLEKNQYSEAEKWLKKALEINPDLAGDWRSLTLVHHYTSLEHPDVKQIIKLLNKPNLRIQDRIDCYFALGNIYDDCEHYDQAFEFYRQGNELQDKRIEFDVNSFSNHVENIMKVFGELDAKTFDFGHEEQPQPLFVFGVSRSGKSVLEELLCQHAAIEDAGELGLPDGLERLSLQDQFKQSYPMWMNSLTQKQAKAIRDMYLSRMQREVEKNKRYIIDTMHGNGLYVGLLIKLFPKAKFIYCKRDPMDVCLLMYYKYYFYGHGYSYHLGKLASYYKQYERLIEFWKKKYPQIIFEVNYEALITSPQKTLSSLMTYLELDEHHHFDTHFLHQNEIGHWRHYDKHLGPLKEGLNAPASSTVMVSDKKEMINQAKYYYQQDDLIHAKSIGEALLKEYPSHYGVVHLLGMIEFKQENYKDAVKYIEQAIKIAPGELQLYVDLANIYNAMGRQMLAERYLKMANELQLAKKTNMYRELKADQRQELMSAFLFSPQIIDEFERRILLNGKLALDSTTDSYITRSWDQYFTDLSFGSYRTVTEGSVREWHMRSWHFLYKNLALVEGLLNDQNTKVRILDIGCSTGYLRRFLEGNINPQDKKEIYYWGLDIRQDVLEDAVKGVDNIESGAKGNFVPSAYIVHDVKHGLPYRDGFFDYVVNFEMIKYLPVAQGRHLLDEMYRVMNSQGKLYLSTSYSTLLPGYMQSVPFEQIEVMLQQHRFNIMAKRGSQSDFKTVSTFFKKDHIALIQDLLTVHPPEMVAAMVTPLYPHCSSQVTFICDKKKYTDLEKERSVSPESSDT
ncbi:MAG: sulfotransferase [Candidatus Berkiellales bacterium]